MQLITCCIVLLHTAKTLCNCESNRDSETIPDAKLPLLNTKKHHIVENDFNKQFGRHKRSLPEKVGSADSERDDLRRRYNTRFARPHLPRFNPIRAPRVQRVRIPPQKGLSAISKIRAAKLSPIVPKSKEKPPVRPVLPPPKVDRSRRLKRAPLDEFDGFDSLEETTNVPFNSLVNKIVYKQKEREEKEEEYLSPFKFEHLIPHTPIFYMLNAPIRCLNHLYKLKDQVVPVVNSVPLVIHTSQRHAQNLGKELRGDMFQFFKNVMAHFDPKFLGDMLKLLTPIKRAKRQTQKDKLPVSLIIQTIQFWSEEAKRMTYENYKRNSQIFYAIAGLERLKSFIVSKWKYGKGTEQDKAHFLEAAQIFPQVKKKLEKQLINKLANATVLQSKLFIKTLIRLKRAQCVLDNISKKIETCSSSNCEELDRLFNSLEAIPFSSSDSVDNVEEHVKQLWKRDVEFVKDLLTSLHELEKLQRLVDIGQKQVQILWNLKHILKMQHDAIAQIGANRNVQKNEMRILFDLQGDLDNFELRFQDNMNFVDYLRS